MARTTASCGRPSLLVVFITVPGYRAVTGQEFYGPLRRYKAFRSVTAMNYQNDHKGTVLLFFCSGKSRNIVILVHPNAP